MTSLVNANLQTNLISADSPFEELVGMKKKLVPCSPQHSGPCLHNDKCQNWSKSMECPEGCKKNCGNRRIFKKIVDVDVKVTKCKSKGFKVIATKPIEKDTFIFEYCGQLRKKDDYEKWCRENPSANCYGLVYDEKEEWVIDATRFGNTSRYVNHSCDPNLKLEEWTAYDGLPRIVLVSNYRIDAGVELTFNYNLEKFKGLTKMHCLCGKRNCKDNPPKKMGRKPKGIVEFVCDICDRKFGRSGHLVRHRKIHTAEKKDLYKCKICSKGFLRMDNLKIHEMSHEKGKKNFKCTTCNQEFLLKQHLETHEMVHKKKEIFKCDVINKSFRRCNRPCLDRSSLLRHKNKNHP